MILSRSISRPVVIGLRLIGIWPGSSYEIIVRCIWVANMMSAQVFQYRYIIKHINSGNLADIVDSVSTTLPYSLLFFKIISFWIKRGIFKNILIGMSRDWIDTSTAKLNVHVMINKAELAYRCSNLIIGVYASAVCIYGGMFLEFSRQDQDDGFNITSRQLLIKMDLPFAYYESPMYEYVFVVQFLQLLATGISIAMLDALIITLILHIGGQIEMLHEALENISIKDEKHGSLRNVIKSLTDHHYRIILNSEYIEKLFSYIALMQLLCNTIVICCIGFLIIVAVNSYGDIKILMKILLFYIAITLEAFIFSYAGEYLSSKSLSVSSSAYGSSWYLLEPRNRRVVILLMIRSQRSLTITAGKFMDLSMIGFATILKASASYVSVLYAMY
ncbi:odorant receptor 22c-like isoform X1 [Bombus affinis]|uniref:odorant receptor 22c-like isoform X1 n=2 Tax=Bombus affinis TaxID=309941 RepID=UPI000A178B96|nr:odorant receptor 22c-like isoform X1 [Bombus affinis]